MLFKKMYIGPSRPYGLNLSENTMILDTDGIYGLQKMLDSHPEMKCLFVHIDDLAVAMQQKRKQESAVAKAFAKVKQDSLALRKKGGK